MPGSRARCRVALMSRRFFCWAAGCRAGAAWSLLHWGDGVHLLVCFAAVVPPCYGFCRLLGLWEGLEKPSLPLPPLSMQISRLWCIWHHAPWQREATRCQKAGRNFSVACLTGKRKVSLSPRRNRDCRPRCSWMVLNCRFVRSSYWGNWLPSPTGCKEMFNAWVLPLPQLS